jgi:hypothetical protein
VAILRVQSDVANPFKEHLMAEYPDPNDPIDPTNCPTCRSGFQPIDPGYEDAIDPKY